MLRPVVRAVAIATVLLTLGGAAAWAGYDEGEEALRRGYYALALKELRPLAERGHPHAQTLLGRMYMMGHGVEQDHTEAVKWYRRAAEEGLKSAQNFLAIMYFVGRGLQQNDVEAAKWFGKAAEQGDTSAQFNLGLMYQSGRGVPQDNVEAYTWLILAVAGSWPSRDHKDRKRALTNRDNIAKRMTPADISKAERLAREWSEKRRGKKK